MKKKTTCFRDEIRRSLIVYALAPCMLSLLFLVFVFAGVGTIQIMYKSKQEGQHFAEEFSWSINDYVQEGNKIRRTLDLESFAELADYRTDVLSDLYQFLNEQAFRGDFYLFDEYKNNVFSTNRDKTVVSYMSNCLGSTKEDEADRDFVFLYDVHTVGGESSPMWCMFSPIMKDGVKAGYCGFALPSREFSGRIGEELTVLLTNRFGRIFNDEGSQFKNERGKLYETLRYGKGFTNYNGRWYYLLHQWILEDNADVITVYNCTSFWQLCVASVGMVLLLAGVSGAVIYFRAGKVANEKTQILYQLLNALDSVEKGDLEVALTIDSADEFGRIGSAFNMMLGSIRHLITRHQELAHENMMSTMQILETQFNPHFLFNTMESIRYMIRFEPKQAEKMLVGLSRLLRYSIQNGKDIVPLKEELDFNERYLQIMLYRYGERLSYQMDAHEDIWTVHVPRMVLQPLVENAIKYGFGSEREHLSISIYAWKEADQVRVVIQDDGVGIGAELLAILEENLCSSQNRSEHIGLYNINKRLTLFYGEQYGLRIKSREGEGTVVEILVPIE